MLWRDRAARDKGVRPITEPAWLPVLPPHSTTHMPCPIPFTQFVDVLSRVYSGPAHAPRTRAKMLSLMSMLPGLGVESTADMTTEMVARFVAVRSQTVNANTVRGDLSYLSAACSFAVEEGWLDRAPKFWRVRPRPARSMMQKVHTIGEIGKVLAFLEARAGNWKGNRLYALAALVAFTGLRRDEALTLQVSDIRLTTGLLCVSDRLRRKTLASAAHVPICPELLAILTAWIPRCGSPWLIPNLCRSGPWTGGMCGQRAGDRLRQAGEECGVHGLTMQSLRHTFATHARRSWGLSPMQLADILRHTSVKTQSYYVHDDPDPGAIVRAVARVSYRETP